MTNSYAWTAFLCRLGNVFLSIRTRSFQLFESIFSVILNVIRRQNSKLFVVVDIPSRISYNSITPMIKVIRMINSTLFCLIFSLIEAGRRAVDLSTRLKVQQATQRTDNRTAEQPTNKICTAAHKPIGNLYLNALLNTTSSYPRARKYNNRQCLDRPHPSAKCPPVARLSPPHIALPAYMLTDKG